MDFKIYIFFSPHFLKNKQTDRYRNNNNAVRGGGGGANNSSRTNRDSTPYYSDQDLENGFGNKKSAPAPTTAKQNGSASSHESRQIFEKIAANVKEISKRTTALKKTIDKIGTKNDDEDLRHKM